MIRRLEGDLEAARAELRAAEASAAAAAVKIDHLEQLLIGLRTYLSGEIPTTPVAPTRTSNTSARSSAQVLEDYVFSFRRLG